jgi:hypothetical protein
MEQFRYAGVSPKGLAFTIAGMLGANGILFWEKVAQRRRERHGANPMPTPTFAGYVTSAHD